MKILFRFLLTVNATSWFVIIYAINKQKTFFGLSIWICGTIYLLIPVLLSLLSLFLFRFSGDDKLTECTELSLADNEFLPVYLGYFFLAVSIDKFETMVFVYTIIAVFTYLSQTQYFNPIFLLFGYHYYHVLTLEGTRVFIIAHGKVLRNKNNIYFDKLKRINDTTYIKRGVKLLSIVMAKIRKGGRSNENKYRRLLSTDELLFENSNNVIDSSCIYAAGAILDDGEWFFIENANLQPFALDLFNHDYQTVDFDSLDKSDFNNIDYLIVQSGEDLFFQNVTRARLVSKKSIIRLGENFEYNNNRQEIVINDLPDAIYVSSENRLYFRRLQSITSIFKGIDQLYREATNTEVESFLDNDFISLQDDYCTSKVKTANRKRIALAKKTLDEFDETDKNKIFDYIGEYCPELKTENNSFKIGSEDELKMLLFGIEQRFYTTPIGGEKRLANSVIPIIN